MNPTIESKKCISCDARFERRYKESTFQWKRRKFCSMACSSKHSPWRRRLVNEMPNRIDRSG